MSPAQLTELRRSWGRVPLAELCQRLGCSPRWVRQVARDHGISQRHNSRHDAIPAQHYRCPRCLGRASAVEGHEHCRRADWYGVM